MSEREPFQRGEQSQADRTLLGVAPPRVDSTAESPTRSPVFVRAGTSVAEEPAPLPRIALPSRSPPRSSAGVPGLSEPPASLGKGGGKAWVIAMLNLPARIGSARVALWKVLAAGLIATLALALLGATLIGSVAPPGANLRPRADAAAAAVHGAAPPGSAAAVPEASNAKPASAALAQLRGKAPETLRASELLQLDEERIVQEREAARALRLKLEATPALAKDKPTQSELLRLAGDPDTAREALAAMSGLEGALAADLLYEVWTGTSVRNDTTELARTLVYSTDVRPKASPALGVALDLRLAETCQQYKATLPQALKDGDRRALHLLAKLANRRGCGPKKAADCFACLRDQPDELTATINAVKSRRPPSHGTP